MVKGMTMLRHCSSDASVSLSKGGKAVTWVPILLVRRHNSLVNVWQNSPWSSVICRTSPEPVGNCTVNTRSALPQGVKTVVTTLPAGHCFSHLAQP